MITPDILRLGLGKQTYLKKQQTSLAFAEAWRVDRRKRLARKKVNYLRNKAARAALYAQNPGEIAAGAIPAYHSTLKALSGGTYG